MNQETSGHDSEFGLTFKGKKVSALDFIRPYEDENGSYFPDNMNCEIAISPVTTLKEFHSKTEGLLSHIRDQGFDLLMEPVIKYPKRCMSNPLALVSGCNPDYSGYTMQENIAPDFETMDGTRSCGAHLHRSLDKETDPFNFARWCDIHIALPLLMHEKPSERRKMYGAAGCLRIKTYGAEYRTLSNVWIDDKTLREFVWDGLQSAALAAKKGDSRILETWWEVPQAIDTHDLPLAAKLLDQLYVHGVRSI